MTNLNNTSQDCDPTIIRWLWMMLLGLSDSEIEYWDVNDPVVSLEDEMQNLEAMINLFHYKFFG